MKKGITLISLIITIISIMILAGITIFSSLETADESLKLRNEAEFDEVCNYVRTINARIEAGLIDLNMPRSSLATEDEIDSFCLPSGDFIEKKCSRVKSINGIMLNDPNNGYHLVRGKDIQNDCIPGLVGIASKDKSFVTPNKVKNDYIINFSSAIVIGKISSNESKVMGEIPKE